MTELPPHIPDTVGYKALPTLLPYQQRWVAGASPLKAIKKSRRTGITWVEIFDNVPAVASSVSAGGMNAYYIAYNQDMTIEYIQARATWAWALDYAVSEIEEGLWEEDGDGKYIRTYVIKFPNSSFRIIALSSRLSNPRGRQGIIAIDKAAFHEQLDGLSKAALAILVWGRKVRVIPAHDGDDNPFNTLIGDIHAGRQGDNVHRIAFWETAFEGLFRRAYLRIGKEWSGASGQAWMASMYKFYGTGVPEELDCIPTSDGGAWLSRALIESRTSADTPILRLTCKEGHEPLSDGVRFHETWGWLDEHLKPLLEAPPVGARFFLGCDFDRSGDLSVDYPLLQEKNLV